MTLSFVGQMLDELSILWALAVGYAIWLPRRHYPSFIKSRYDGLINTIDEAALAFHPCHSVVTRISWVPPQTDDSGGEIQKNQNLASRGGCGGVCRFGKTVSWHNLRKYLTTRWWENWLNFNETWQQSHTPSSTIPHHFLSNRLVLLFILLSVLIRC